MLAVDQSAFNVIASFSAFGFPLHHLTSSIAVEQRLCVLVMHGHIVQVCVYVCYFFARKCQCVR